MISVKINKNALMKKKTKESSSRIFFEHQQTFCFQGKICDHSQHQRFIFTLVVKFLLRRNLLFIPKMIFNFSFLAFQESMFHMLPDQHTDAFFLSFLKMADASCRIGCFDYKHEIKTFIRRYCKSRRKLIDYLYPIISI